MTLHDDDPEHFEFFLKFMYTHHYDKDAIVKLAAEKSTRRVTIPSEILVIADKYDMPLLAEPIAQDIEGLLANKNLCTLGLLKIVISAHYKQASSPGGPVGMVLVSKIKNHFHDFSNSDEFVSLVKAYPVFGADIVLYQTGELRSLTCFVGGCGHSSIVNSKALSSRLLFPNGPFFWYCEKCGNKSILPPK
jgi:hypothetical protein